jgi:hypothetical protein
VEPTVQIILAIGATVAWNLRAGGSFLTGLAEYTKARKLPTREDAQRRRDCGNSGEGDCRKPAPIQCEGKPG